MRVVACEVRPGVGVYVPDFAVADDGTKSLRDGKAGGTAAGPPPGPFDLPDGSWFAVDGLSVVRFPREREWDWRSRRAKEIVESLPQDPDELSDALHSAAGLAGVDLPGLITRLRDAAVAGEDLADVFKRLRRR